MYILTVKTNIITYIYICIIVFILKFFNEKRFKLLQSELPTWRFNSRNSEIKLWRSIAMCLAARRRIDLLMKLDHPYAVNAALNKLLSFHLTLSRYGRN